MINVIIREGGYVRYDNQRMAQIHRNCEMLLIEYNGSLNRHHDIASDSDDIEERFIKLHGIGPVPANIFLRELRPLWEKSNPESLLLVRETAERYGICLDQHDRKRLAFARVEGGLIQPRHKSNGDE